MIGFSLGFGIGAAVNYALGRHTARFTWEHYRRDWWITFACILIPLGGAFGMCGFMIEKFAQ